MLEGKVALVTGSSRGIGRAVAIKLAEQGANICINYVSGQRKAESAAKEIEAKGAQALVTKADVSDSKQVRQMVQRAVKEFGTIDILVNNAGIQVCKPLSKLTDEIWHRVIDVHLTGTFNCTKCVAGVMIKRKSGRIINISSVAGIMGLPGIIPYCAAKAGIIGLTKATAKELAPFNIKVNAVAPGFILTDLIGGERISKKERQGFEKHTLLKRLGKPEEVAGLVCYLASEEADYITGEVINISGGALI